ncbi:MAG: RNA polymerase sigma factor [Thermodesulfobacteriota bacterium]
MDADVIQMLEFQAGNQRAFQVLFDKYRKRIIHFCYRFCGDPLRAEELAQEVFLNVYKGAADYRPTAKFSTWLFQIATHACLNELRNAGYRQRIDSLDAPMVTSDGEARPREIRDLSGPPDEVLEQREREALIQRALMELPEKQRAALSLRVLNGFSYQEIGSQIHCSENSVKTLIHRGRQQLKRFFQQLEQRGDAA